MRAPDDPIAAGMTIRPAFPDDRATLTHLAALDSQRLPSGPLLLAEIGGEPWAAIALETGRVFADPFRPTAAVVDLLRRRAGQLAAGAGAGAVSGRARAGRRAARARLADPPPTGA
jgi:hypothetical protein